jgi:DNA-directed RNA polymerase specialized sigma24 family protein
MPVHSDLLLRELQGGERETFVRYFQLYRASVYTLVRKLLRDDEAVPATTEAFTTAYHRILLGDVQASLHTVTYAAALDVCRQRIAEKESDADAAGACAEDRSDPASRFERALMTLPFQYRAALCLRDFAGLETGDAAAVFGVTTDAAAAQLFRAREAFRRAFEDMSLDVRGTTCRLAEQTAAGAVGRKMSDYEMNRLREHAAYCRDCRRTMKTWRGGAAGLALFLRDEPPPLELERTPVFGFASPNLPALSVAAGSGALKRRLAPAWRMATSKAAAYVVAAACIALAVAVAAQPQGGVETPVTPSFIVPWTVPTTSGAGTPGAPDAAPGGGATATGGERRRDEVGPRPDTSSPRLTAVADARVSRSALAPVATTGSGSDGAVTTSGSPAGAGADETGPAAPSPRATPPDDSGPRATNPSAPATKSDRAATNRAARDAKRLAVRAAKEQRARERLAMRAAKHGTETRHGSHARRDARGEGQAAEPARRSSPSGSAKADKGTKGAKSAKKTKKTKDKKSEKSR